jgi:hypothetical protein
VLLTLAMASMPAGSAFLWSVWGARLLRGAPAGASWQMWTLALLPVVSSLSVVLIRPRLKAVGLRLAFSLGLVLLGLALAAAGLRFEWLAAGGAPGPTGVVLWRLSLLPIPIACLALWLWGEWVGHGTIGQRDVRLALSRNVMTILLLYLFYNSAPVLTVGEALGPIVLVFVAGVLALAASNLERLRVQREGAPVAPVLDRYWLQTVAGLTAVLLLAGLLITGLANTRVFAQAGGVVLVALAAVAIGLSWILVAFGVLIFLLLYPLRGLFQSISTQMLLPTPAPTSPALATAQAAAPSTAAAPSPIFEAAGWVVAVGILVALILMVFWLRLRSEALARTETAEEVRDSILSGDLLWRQLQNLFGGRRGSGGKEPAAYLPLGGEATAARVRIRRAYQAALQWAFERGRVRAPSETPRAFARALDQLSLNSVAGRALTEAYQPARYAAEEPAPQMAEQAEASLASLVASDSQRELHEDRS